MSQHLVVLVQNNRGTFILGEKSSPFRCFSALSPPLRHPEWLSFPKIHPKQAHLMPLLEVNDKCECKAHAQESRAAAHRAAHGGSNLQDGAQHLGAQLTDVHEVKGRHYDCAHVPVADPYALEFKFTDLHLSLWWYPRLCVGGFMEWCPFPPSLMSHAWLESLQRRHAWGASHSIQPQPSKAMGLRDTAMSAGGKQQGLARVEVFLPTQSKNSSFLHWKRTRKSLLTTAMAFMLAFMNILQNSRWHQSNKTNELSFSSTFAQVGRLCACLTSLDFPMLCLCSHSIGTPMLCLVTHKTHITLIRISAAPTACTGPGITAVCPVRTGSTSPPSQGCFSLKPHSFFHWQKKRVHKVPLWLPLKSCDRSS